MSPSDKFSGKDTPREQSAGGRNEFLLQAESYLERGQWRDAMALARERIGLHPGDADARLIFGIALRNTGREKEALVVLEELQEDLRRWARALEYLGDLYRGKGEIEKARTCYQAYAGLGTDPAAAERLLGKMESLDEPGRESRGDAPADLSGDFKTLTVAELYLRQGHIEQAAVLLEEIVRTQPQSERARELLQQARTRLERERPGRPARPPGAVAQELDRWLRNVSRLRNGRH